MSAIKLESRARARLRRIGITLFGAAVSAAIAASALAADTVTLRVGDQKGGNRSLLEISGYAKDLRTGSNGRNFLLPRRSWKR
jgi:sulfonate transport system substrate-binding protein